MILPLVRRFMGIGWGEWRGMSWAEQRAILDYMDMAEDIPFGYQETGADGLPAGEGPQQRTVDTGQDVIDLTKMRAELEAERAGRH